MQMEPRNEAVSEVAVRSQAVRPGVSRRPVVLLALYETGRPTSSLLRAVALGRVLGADVHVIRVLPLQARVNPLFPQNHLADAVGAVEGLLRADRSTRAWLRACLGRQGAADAPALVVQGDFVQRVAEEAASLGAVLVVVPPRARRLGHTVTSLACATGLPVLVARKATRGDTIVAATDLESPGYPVLRRAARLSQQLDAPVVAVHNLTPMASVMGLGPGAAPGLMLGDPVLQDRSAHLSWVAQGLAANTHSVVRTEVDPVDAILAEARTYDADLVVVGTHRRNWFQRLLRGSVAAQVVNRAKRSVLVTPLKDSGEAGAAPPLA